MTLREHWSYSQESNDIIKKQLTLLSCFFCDNSIAKVNLQEY